MKYRTRRAPHRGYTLIELIVSLGVFGVVVTLAAGGYFIVLNAMRHAQASAVAIDNFSFVLEKMTRSIRTGSDYDSFVTTFSFIDANGNDITYSLLESGGQGVIQETRDNGVTSVTSTITDASIDVNTLAFDLVGKLGGPGDGQPRVTIFISGTVSTGPGDPPAPFTIQTGATTRAIDL